MKISVITVCRNAVSTIEDSILSVSGQTCSDVEHIIIDGGSEDGTQALIHRHEDLLTKWVSEKDKGIYDAMNKGITLASGDVVAFLNADDVYAHENVLETVSNCLLDEDIDACFGDVVFVREDMETVARYYRSSGFSRDKIAYGWMPAHPALFLRKSLFDKYGLFKTDYRIAADYELVARLFGVHAIKYRYIRDVFVKMRRGGVSTRGIKNSYILNKEIVKACRENGIRTNLLKVFLKVPVKLMEYVVRPL